MSQAAAASRPYRGLVLDTCAPPVACPRRGNRAMQILKHLTVESYMDIYASNSYTYYY